MGDGDGRDRPGQERSAVTVAMHGLARVAGALPTAASPSPRSGSEPASARCRAPRWLVHRGRPCDIAKVSSDVELLERWRAGEASAGERLFERYFDTVQGFFANKVDADVEDLVQETFLGCVRGRDAIRDDASFRIYLFQIARNNLYQYIRKKYRRGDVVDFAEVSIADLGVSPSGHVGRVQDERLLLEALRHLPLDFQIALELYYFEQVRGSQLAEILGIPPGTVRSRIRRGLEHLRKILDRLTASPVQLQSTLTRLDDWAAEIRDARKEE